MRYKRAQRIATGARWEGEKAYPDPTWRCFGLGRRCGVGWDGRDHNHGHREKDGPQARARSVRRPSG